MADALIRGVPAEVLSAIDVKAARLGLSRSEYLRRQLVRAAAGSDDPVTAESLRRFSERLADLADADVMGRAWA
jgi:hypothetical protein